VVSDADCQVLAHWGSLFVPSIPQDAGARRERNFVTVNQDILAIVESMERQIVQRAVRNDTSFPKNTGIISGPQISTSLPSLL